MDGKNIKNATELTEFDKKDIGNYKIGIQEISV